MSYCKSSQRSQAIQPFYVMQILARAKELEAQGHDVIHLEVGEPDFATADTIIQAGHAALEQQLTHYTPALGIPELRQAIASYYQKQFGVALDWQRVVVTPGASGALMLALSLLTDAGDRVLLSDPGYPCNRHFARLLNIETDNVPTDAASGFQLTPELLAQNWHDNTRAVMLASPSNPIGSVIDRSDMQALCDFVQNRHSHVIVDEIYQGLVYDSDNITALQCWDDAIVINSFSKFFGMTGWRLGWMVVPQDCVEYVDAMAQNIFLAPPTLSQHAALAAFTDEATAEFERRRQIFQQRRDYLLPALQRLGFDVPVTPQGAFYIYAGCRRFTDDSFRFVNDLLEQAHVAVTPGRDFGDNRATEYVRFAYTRPVEVLDQAVLRIEGFLKSQADCL